MTRDPLASKRTLSAATSLHALEWGAAVVFASVGSHADLGWRMVACGLVAAMSIQRVRRAQAHVETMKGGETVKETPAAPSAAEPEAPAPAAPKEEPAPETKKEGKKETKREPVSAVMSVPRVGTVLLAEDDPTNQVLVATQLRSLGYTVTIAGNGRAVVDLAIAAARASDPFDVVLMDMQMPEMDGYTAANELRTRGYKGSIVALTAHAMRGDRERCLDAGCDEYLTKPVNRQQLLAAIRASVEIARTAMETADTCSRRITLPDSSEPLRSEFADDPDMADIVVEFVQILELRASALTAALAKNDMETMKRLVHQVKGAAGGYGFPSITEQAKNVEHAMAAAGDGTQLKKAVESLCSLCIRAGFRAEPARRAVA